MERWRRKLTGSYAWVLFVAPKLPVIEVINDGSGGKRLALWQPERKRPSGGVRLSFLHPELWSAMIIPFPFTQPSFHQSPHIPSFSNLGLV